MSIFPFPLYLLSKCRRQQNQKDSRFIRISLPVDIDFSVQNLGLYCCFLTNQIFDHSLLNMSKLYNRHTTGYYSLYWDSIFDFNLCRLVLFSESCMNQEINESGIWRNEPNENLALKSINHR